MKIALTGGFDFNDHHLIWERLDKVFAKHSDMVLIHGGSPKGAELIAAKWATARKVPQIAFKPDWAKHAKAAPFKRNDAMLELLPIGVALLKDFRRVVPQQLAQMQPQRVRVVGNQLCESVLSLPQNVELLLGGAVEKATHRPDGLQENTCRQSEKEQ